MNRPKSTVAESICRRRTVYIDLPYKDLLSAFEAELGVWDPALGDALVGRSAPWSEVEAQITPLGRPHGLMLFYKADQGKIASLGAKPVDCALFMVGNPVIATGIIDVDIMVGMLVPFRVEVAYNGQSGLVSYELPSSLLGSLANPRLTKVGAELDQKMDAVITALQARTASATP